MGATPECDVLLPHFDSDLQFDMPSPGGPLFDDGVSGGVTWDGTFHRDTTRYPAGGQLFWSAYLKPGSVPGADGGYWLNFGSGWSHLQNDDLAQMLGGAAPRIYYDDKVGRDSVEPSTLGGGAEARQSLAPPQWKLVVEATMFVTDEMVLVWSGVKVGGNDPCGVYARVDGLDTTGMLTIEAGV